MSWLLTNVIAQFLLPPAVGLLPAFAGLFLLGKRPRLGRGLLTFGLVLLLVLSLPAVGKLLLLPLESRYPALPLENLGKLQVDAVVILGGGRYREAPEFGGEDDVKEYSLGRLRYGALVAKASGAPILLTGGIPDGGRLPEGRAMAVALERDFGMRPRWIEDRSDNTRQNALYSAEILQPAGRRRIALVTDAFHMPRAVGAFEAAGFEVIPAPTSFLAGSRPSRGILDFLPQHEGMRKSSLAFHEGIGLIWYSLKK